MTKISWLDDPEEHDYPAAIEYLSLLVLPVTAESVIEKLRKADVVQFKAKDIFRASRLSVLGVSNHHVEKNLIKIRDGKPMSPILLVRSINLGFSDGSIVICDGYHRLCSVYIKNEDAEIPCKII